MSDGYDQWSNRLSQTVTAGSGPSSSLTFNGHNQPTGSGFVYDASGDMTYDPATLDTYTYDDDNRLVTVSGGASASYTYDDNGLRVQKSANGTTTVYIYSGSKDIAEYDNGAAPSSPSREFIYGNDELLATVSGSTTTYYQADHLSVRMTTDPSGNVLGQQGHFPFGEAWYSTNGSSEWVFTTYQHNQETGLEYALARYYDPRTAAFCSADPVGGDPSDPESWNRYVYARDNPINIIDPSGQFSLFDIFKIIGLIAADVFSGGTATEATLPSLIGELEGWTSFAETVSMLSHEGQQPGQHPQLPPALRLPAPPPDTYTKCPPVLFTITGVGPHQALGKGAGGFPPPTGTAAYHPQDFGLGKNQAKALDKSNTQIFFQPDWSKAQIPGRNGGIVRPAPSRGMPQIPSGLPTEGPIEGTDSVYPPVSHHIDVYRYPTQAQGNAAKRIVPTTTYIPKGVGAKCPKPQ